MSNLSRQRCLELGDEHFALPEHKACPIFDERDVVKAVLRAPFAKDPEGMRLRIAEIATRKGLRVPPTLAREQLVLLARRTVAEGLVSLPAQRSILRATVSSAADIDRFAEAAKQQLKEKEQMSTNFQSRHDTAEGRNALQQVHDITSRFGAVCVAPGKLSADFVSKHESGKLQKIHDLAIEGGARCRAVGDNVFSEAGEDANFGLRDPKELAREHSQRRNEKRQVAARSENSVPQSTRAHIAKRNAQVMARKEKAKEVEEGGGINW